MLACCPRWQLQLSASSGMASKFLLFLWTDKTQGQGPFSLNTSSSKISSVLVLLQRKRKWDLWNAPSLKGGWELAGCVTGAHLSSCICNRNTSTFRKSVNGLLSVRAVHRHYKTCNYFYCRAIKYRSVKVWVQKTRASYSSDQRRWESITDDENKVLENPLELFVATCNDSTCNHIKSKHLLDFVTNFLYQYCMLI